MRVMTMVFVFLILLNGWAGIMQAYGLDHHIGVSENPAIDEQQLEDQKKQATQYQIAGGSLVLPNSVGLVLAIIGNFQAIAVGAQPAAQIMAQIAPRGIATDLIKLAFSIVPIVVTIEILSFIRGIK